MTIVVAASCVIPIAVIIPAVAVVIFTATGWRIQRISRPLFPINHPINPCERISARAAGHLAICVWREVLQPVQVDDGAAPEPTMADGSGRGTARAIGHPRSEGDALDLGDGRRVVRPRPQP